jgi:hypothetical protein
MTTTTATAIDRCTTCMHMHHVHVRERALTCERYRPGARDPDADARPRRVQLGRGRGPGAGGGRRASGEWLLLSVRRSSAAAACRPQPCVACAPQLVGQCVCGGGDWPAARCCGGEARGGGRAAVLPQAHTLKRPCCGNCIWHRHSGTDV